MSLLVVSALQFLAKPFLAVQVGTGADAQAYLGTTYAALSQSLAAILLVATGLFMLLVIARDVMADIEQQSETDKLSSLFNRRGFEERGQRALEHAMRQGLPLALVVADLDHFKQINDTHGHARGDDVIVAFAQTLRDCADGRVIIGRMGGEEFAAVLPGANLAAGRLYAETVRSAFGTSAMGWTLPDGKSASFGVAAVRPGETWADIMHRADVALYQAKRMGRNRVITAPDVWLEAIPGPVATAKRR